MIISISNIFSIKYIVKIKRLDIYDIKIYIKKHLLIYISFLVLFLVGVFFGVVIGLSSENFLKLLTSNNKILFSIINGTIGTGSLFWKKLIQLFLPMIIIFILNLNYYLGLLSYIIIAYQSGLLTLTIFAIVSTYGISGVLNVLFIILPINILYILVLIYFAVVCLIRSYNAKRNKCFALNFKSNEFILSILIGFLCVLLITLVGTIIIPLFLKNAIFVIF